MSNARHVVAAVSPEHTVEVSVPDLLAGQVVDVLVVADAPGKPAPRSLLELLDSLPPGPCLFETPAQVADYFQSRSEEQGQWHWLHRHDAAWGKLSDEPIRDEALQASEDCYRSLVQNSTDLFAVLDSRGSVVYQSPSVERILGRSPADLVGTLLPAIVHPDDAGRVRGFLAETRQTPGVSPPLEFRLRHESGEWRTLEAVCSNLLDVASVRGIVVNARDVSERVRAERDLEESRRRLEESEQWHRALFEHGVDAAFSLDLRGAFLDANPNCRAILGRAPDELRGLCLPDLIASDDQERVKLMLARARQGEAQAEEIGLAHPDGTRGDLWLGLTPLRLAGKVVALSGAARDVSARKALDAERERVRVETERLLAQALEWADRDPVTNLWNHRAFHARFSNEAAESGRAGTPLAVVVLDLDNFKFFNDAYGHPVGDDVLRQVARALERCCRPEDTLARFGGDEFALLLPGRSPDDLREATRGMACCLDDLRFRPPGHDTPIPLTLSLGMAVFPDEGSTVREALEIADSRLRRAKAGEGGSAALADRLRASLTRSLAGFSLLDGLVAAVDAKDRYTRRHSEDVLAYSLQIAQALGLDEATQKTVAAASLLHDIGKIGVPDSILRKPGRLTEVEFEAIRQHPTMGALIVGALADFTQTCDAVRHHHERWDGQGYPFGLRGEETPLMARLMAVADAFSAMTTDRPYRKGLSSEEAWARLNDGSGTQWDPACVEAFGRGFPLGKQANL